MSSYHTSSDEESDSSDDLRYRYVERLLRSSLHQLTREEFAACVRDAEWYREVLARGNYRVQLPTKDALRYIARVRQACSSDSAAGLASGSAGGLASGSAGGLASGSAGGLASGSAIGISTPSLSSAGGLASGSAIGISTPSLSSAGGPASGSAIGISTPSPEPTARMADMIASQELVGLDRKYTRLQPAQVETLVLCLGVYYCIERYYPSCGFRLPPLPKDLRCDGFDVWCLAAFTYVTIFDDTSSLGLDRALNYDDKPQLEMIMQWIREASAKCLCKCQTRARTECQSLDFIHELVRLVVPACIEESDFGTWNFRVDSIMNEGVFVLNCASYGCGTDSDLRLHCTDAILQSMLHYVRTAFSQWCRASTSIMQMYSLSDQNIYFFSPCLCWAYVQERYEFSSASAILFLLWGHAFECQVSYVLRLYSMRRENVARHRQKCTHHMLFIVFPST